MAKYLSGRVQRIPQSGLTSDRYSYLSLDQAEPNLGDPAVPGVTLPAGVQYQMVSVLNHPGERYWIPVGGGLIPGSISVYNEGFLVPPGGVSSITQLNFVGAAISASGYLDSYGNPGTISTITVFAPGNNKELIFNSNNEFSSSVDLTYDTNTGILTAARIFNVGTGGTVFSTTGIGSVGIGTTNPSAKLHIVGDLRLTGTIYDYANNPGTTQQILAKNALGSLVWTSQGSIKAGAGGTFNQVQYHNSTGLVDGAATFVYDPINSRVGIGSTLPTYLLDVAGDTRITGIATLNKLYVTGISTFSSSVDSTNATSGALIISGGVGIAKNLNVGATASAVSLTVTGQTTTQNLNVVGVSTLFDINGTSANFTGIVTASTFKGQISSGVGTITTFNSTTGTITALTGTAVTYTTGNITTLNGSNVYYNVGIITALSSTNSTLTNIISSGISTLGITSTTQLTARSLNVSGITTTQTLNVSSTSTFGGTITPSATTTYNIGSINYKWNSLYVSTIVADTITGNTTTATSVIGGYADITSSNVSGISTTQYLVVTGNSSLGIATATSVTAATFTGALIGIANTATKLATGRTIAITGDLAYTSPSFDGTTNVTAIGTLANTGVTSTTYGSTTTIPQIAVDAKGRITSASSVSVNFSSQTVASADKLTNGRTIAITGDLTYTSPSFDGTTNITAIGTLANTGVVANTYGNTTTIPQITVDAKGRVTSVSSIGVNFSSQTVASADKLTNGRTIAITGDLTYTSPSFDGTTNITATSTLASTGVSANTYGSGSQVPVFAVDSKGRITSVTNTSITGINASSVAAAGSNTQIQFNDSNVFAGNANLTFNKATNTFATSAITANSITIAGDGSALYGPNSTWAQYLRVGGNGNADTTNASVVTTNGNLHLDAKTGAFATYINYYKGTGGVNFGNGASATVGSVDSSGNSSFRTIASTVATGTSPLTVTSTTQVTNLNSNYLNGITTTQFFNNMGNNHSTRTDFNSSTNFGFNYVQGSTNGPGIPSATQYYNLSIGLGNDYAYSQYAMEFAVPRTPIGGLPYPSVRFREGGTWGSWSKIYAGYADSAGSSTNSTNATTATNLSGGSVAATTGTFSNYLRTLEQVRATGWYGTPTGSSYTGLAVEMGVSGGNGYTLCYNRDTSAYGNFNLAGAATNILLPSSGTTITVTGSISATGSVAGTNITSGGNVTGSSTSCSGNAATASSVVNTVAGTGSIELVRGNMADNDQFRILVGGTATNAGYVEIATADDGTEPIYVRQYTGVFSSLTRTATLLDGSGNTSFPGTVSGTNITSGGNVTGSSASCSGNAATATTATNQSGGTVSATTGSFSSTLTVGGAIVRSAAGVGYLSGNYSSSESVSTSGAIYTIGGSYVPTSTTLGNMYGIGYGYAGNGGIGNPGGVGSSIWGMYVASAGTARVFLDSDNGRGHFASYVVASNITSGGNVTGSSASCSGNAATATNLSTGRTNWSTNGTITAVVGQLSWKNYGNNHTIFDASASTSPDGGAVNNTNSQVAWSSTYPTLMGWNGANTFGVRVDSARIADTVTSLVSLTVNQTSYSCTNPITTATGNTINIASTSNAYGAKYVQSTAPASPCDGDVWYDTSGTVATGGEFASGTVLLFYQASAPTGWSQVMTHNDKALRVVTGTGGGSGGSTAFTSAFTSRTVPLVNHNHSITDPTHYHLMPGDDMLDRANGYAGWTTRSAGGFPYDAVSSGSGGAQVWYTTNASTGITINNASATQGTGNTMDFAVQYIDIILCSKN